PLGVLGLSHIHKANFILALCTDFSRKALVITPDEAQAARFVSDLTEMGANALLYPAKDFAFRSTEGQSREYEHSRLGVLGSMLEGTVDIVVSCVEAAMQLTIPTAELATNSLTIKNGVTIPPADLTALLLHAGYTRSEQVDGLGQFALRGGILDFFPPSSAVPCRLEFWGDIVDSIFSFDIESQRSLERLEQIKVTPANEILCGENSDFAQLIEGHMLSLKGKGSVKARASLLADIDRLKAGVRLSSFDRYLPLVYPQAGTLFDYAGDSLLFVSESFAVKERAAACEKLHNEEVKAYFEEGVLCKGLDRFTLPWTQFIRKYEESATLYLDNLPRGSFDTPVHELITVNARQLPLWNGSLALLLEDIRPVIEKGDFTFAVMAGSEKSARALSLDLTNEGIENIFYPSLPEIFPKETVCVMPGGLSAGMEYPAEKFQLITYGSRITRGTQQARRKKEQKTTAFFSSLEELIKGDYIVHTIHGIGIYEGIVTLEASGTVKDYIKIKYDKADILYVPVTQLDQVSKYIGPRGDDKFVKLNKLGGKEWQKTRSRVKAAVKDMAEELVVLYAKRKAIKGFAFSPDIDMQNDFELRFEFQETPDQLRCIDEIKQDMEKPYPMDRLLCGDVGFGKTEVALRAAFKCIADGKQCAILVPTTILALQHYQTIKKRFEGFPIESAMLSRFRTPKQIEKTLTALKRGSVDIVVGTHRLISKDIKFRDLGLIVVDEEQRFGVAQKERLKELFPAVDVLTLTATPIPRTLNMAMSGIRDMSVLEEAPQDRHPVQTYVIEHDMEVLAQAITSELRRGGQVYYLHNRVETIQRAAVRLQEFLPDARIRVAHGKMNEDELSDTWRGLLESEIDILVCTTIIETGVDVPNVNTLIIEDAERMGLAQLHQIRGRVGRSSRRASAYLTFVRGKQLTEIATRRLSAIREFTEFGSGFKIAMRDLELRGAGNILGAQQHGHLESVGYDMYLNLLAQAVGEQQGEKPAVREKECLIDLQIDAYIPEKYIQSVPQKLGMYRRIADIRSKEDADDVLDELDDRFGQPPASVRGLISVALIRGAAVAQGVYEIGQQADMLLLYIEDLDLNKVNRLAQRLRGRIKVRSAAKPHIAVSMLSTDDQLELLTRIFGILAGGG
ncbi:MAG TPA: transcription-repair coupling factor, partial [Clostridia bacterium]|nr:transcription-repair coupling factor [Clostridia bacterium]